MTPRAEDAQVFIRDAKPDDFEGWASLFREMNDSHRDAYLWYFRDPDDSQMRAFFDSILAIENARLFVAEKRGEIVGMALLKLSRTTFSIDFPFIQPRLYAFLSVISVTERERRQGIGRALIEASKRYAVENGATSLELIAWEENRAALSFYDSLGFETVNRRFRVTL